MPAGIAQQIDELDQLLDKLLHLPIDRASTTPSVVPLKPVSQVLEPESTKPILRFTKELPGLVLHEEESTPSLEELTDQQEATTSIEQLDVSIPVLSINPAADDAVVETETPAVSLPVEEVHLPVVSTTPVREKLPAEEIAWLDDEPLPVSVGTGPTVEIIHGITSQIIIGSDLPEPPAVQVPKRRTWLFWIFWTWTWLFDQTVGRLFPFFRRPAVKFVLGLMGVALFAVSIYLTWTGLTQ